MALEGLRHGLQNPWKDRGVALEGFEAWLDEPSGGSRHGLRRVEAQPWKVSGTAYGTLKGLKHGLGRFEAGPAEPSEEDEDTFTQ
eukprot:1150478-Pelagomonas_calceolata.AAC.5